MWPSPHASQRTFSQLLSGAAGAAMFAAAQGGMRGGGEAHVRVGYGRGRVAQQSRFFSPLHKKGRTGKVRDVHGVTGEVEQQARARRGHAGDATRES